MATEPAAPALATATPPDLRPGRLRPMGVYDSWATVTATALAACAAWWGCVWISLHLTADPALHTAALFVHLASLILGFGAVLAADYYGLLWITGRCDLRTALGSTSRLHTPIWVGLAGLVLSGTLLHPDTSAGPTRVKLALVLVLTLNGLQAGLLDKRMARLTHSPTPRLLAWGGATALVSQLCWWGAVVIGFRNSQR